MEILPDVCFKVRDLFQQEDLGVFKNSFTVTVDPSSVAMVKVSQL